MDDEEETGIDTKIKCSNFYWKNNKYSRKIYHSASSLPELSINEGNVLFSWFTKMFRNRVDDKIDTVCCCIDAVFEKNCQSPMDKSSASEDASFIGSVIYPGKNRIYKNEGHNATVKIISSNVDKDGMLEYIIEFPSGETEEVS